MFGDLFGFGGLSGQAKPVGEHYERADGQWFLILHKLEGFRGAFLAVEVDGPEDLRAFDRPVQMILHQPTFDKAQERVRQNERLRIQKAFVDQVRDHEWSHLLLKKTVLPNGKIKRACPLNCSAQVVYGGLGGEQVCQHDEFIDRLCPGHKAIAEAYLVEHPEAWPPAAKEEAPDE